MITREDYPNGVALTPQQQTFREQFAREGAQQIRLGKKRRKLLFVALVPLSTVVHGSKAGLVGATELRESPFVSGSDVGVLTLSDHPARYPNKWHFIESRVLVNTGFIDSGGAPCVGGDPEFCKLRADFSKGPLMRGQQALQCEDQGELVSPRNGVLRIQRAGRWIDICVGMHGSEQNTVVYRLADSLLEGERPCAVLSVDTPDGLPDAGQVYEYEDVKKGEVLVTLTKKCQYFRASFADNGEPQMQWPPGRVLPASKTAIFEILNFMNVLQNDMTLLPARERPPLVDPEDWAFTAMIAFERRTAQLEDGTKINVDPNSITTLPGFTLSQALKDDFRKAVGPYGDFHLLAEHSGIVATVDEVPGSPHLKQLIMQSGDAQLIPSTANLYRVKEGQALPIEIGTELTAGEVLGDPCQRARYQSWETLAEVLKDNLYWMIEEFLVSTAVSHGDFGWEGHETLYDARYVSSVLDYCAVAHDDSPRWYWDIRKAQQYYDTELNAIVLPPVRYENWDQLEIVLNGVQYDLNDPFSPVVASEESEGTPARVGQTDKEAIPA